MIIFIEQQAFWDYYWFYDLEKWAKAGDYAAFFTAS